MNSPRGRSAGALGPCLLPLCSVELELSDAGQMGLGPVRPVQITDEMSHEIRDKFAELGKGEGDEVRPRVRCLPLHASRPRNGGRGGGGGGVRGHVTGGRSVTGVAFSEHRPHRLRY